jgi:hypothetical protein
MESRRELMGALRPGVLCLALAASAGAAGVPMSLTQAQFDAQIAGLTVVVEDFESYPAADFASPFDIANGVFVSTAPRVQSSLDLCAVDQCLFDSGSTAGIRTFASFPAGAQFWGADLYLVDVRDTLKLTVTGVSGDLEVETSGSGFLGFVDPLGLLSITFQNLGTDLGGGDFGIGNYSFDNVRTAAPLSSVSEPGAPALLGVAVAGVWAVRRIRLGCFRRNYPRPEEAT